MEKNESKVYFVGAGPGATDLITLRGRALLEQADVIVYAGSLVNPAHLAYAKAGCEIHDSASMTLEEVLQVLSATTERGALSVRLHTGDPSLYGAIREQMDELAARGIGFEVVPGVSSFSAAAAALGVEYTLPSVSQSLIITRAAGRTPVPAGESLASFAAHRASMALFLSSGMIDRACDELIAGGYPPETPAAIVYKASWPDERVVRATLGTVAAEAAREKIERTALILVGGFLGDRYDRSLLYDPAFSHGYRQGTMPAVENVGGEAKGAEDDSPRGTVAEEDILLAAFTEDGLCTADKLRKALGGRIFVPARLAESRSDIEALDQPLAEWTARWFDRTKALVFVSAAGIAVRAVASCVRSKTSDPAVVCLDDLGHHVIPLLSGHLGGANELAGRIAAVTGGRAIVTTSTDIHGITAADSWARESGLTVENPEAIRAVSSAMIMNEAVGVAVTEEAIAPPWPVTLWLRPRNLVLGVGSKRGIPLSELETAIADFLEGAGVSPLSLAALASIDLKRDEPAIREWCAARGLDFHTFSAAELERVEGVFSSSERVWAVTGTDNVCERAAMLAGQALSAGRPPALMRSKTAYPGITLALVKIKITEVAHESAK